VLALALALALSFALGSTARAQTEGGERRMTVEELERHIAEQRAELERVRESRDETARKARDVQAELAEKERMRREREAELERLCRERDALEPGSLEKCVEQFDSKPGKSAGEASDGNGES